MPQGIRGFNAVAVILLACAIASAFLSFRAGEEASHTLGPQALAVVGGRVWIADGESLLVADRDGHVLQEYSFATLGVENVGSINTVDDQRMLIASRGSLTLRLLDGEARLLRTIPLRFPGGLDKQENHTLWLASTPADVTGHFRIAVATGGNHAVALFDDEGRFLARTPDHLYRYTNGIWYADEGWWTTDTNRYTLRRLALDTLEQTGQIKLGGDHAQRYLSAAIASRGAPDRLGKGPLGTLFRLQNGMTVGRVVDVFPDGQEIEYPLPANAEPMDLVWLGNELLVAEGAFGNIRRFDASRWALDEFGDFALRQRFKKIAERRAAAEEAHRAWLYGAGGCLVGALICVALARRTPKALREAHPALPLPDWKTQLRLVAPWAWPILSLLAFAALLGAYAAPVIEPVIKWAQHQRELPPAILVSMVQIAIVSTIVAAMLAIFAWAVRQVRRQSCLVEFEQLYNLGALAWLKRNRVWRELCRNDEHPLEVIQTGEEPPDSVKKWDAAKLTAFAHLSIDARDQAVTYRVLSRCTATRICSHLDGIPVHPPTPDKPAPDKAAQGGKEIGKPWQQTFCSALIPGLGQWMQRRTGTALSLFLAAACIFTFMLFPLAMTLITGSADVCPSVEWKYAKLWGFLSLMSAFDAWLMARRNITHSPKPK